jgi:spermidine/putrescine transport system permease protein
VSNEKIKIRKDQGSYYAYLMGIWFTLFFLLPIILILVYSFLQKGVYGGVIWHFSLDAYKQIFQSSYGMIVFRTLIIALEATAITIAIAIPCALALARSKRQTLFLILIIIPFLINSLLRIFAWMSILGNDGLINKLLISMHFTEEGFSLLYNRGAVILVMVYMYLPYAILPIFSTIGRFDFGLLDAARDLGATKMQSYTKVLLPSIKSGINTALLFTFIPAFGAYTIPLFVGGMDSYLLGNLIVDQVNKTRNWPFAAALSVLLTLVSTALVLYVFVNDKGVSFKRKKGAKHEY